MQMRSRTRQTATRLNGKSKRIFIAIISLVALLFVVVFGVIYFLRHSETAFQASDEATVAIDGSQRFQTMDGLGVNANSSSWNNGELKPAIDSLVDTMNVQVWRVIVESMSNWEPVNDNSDPQNFNWAYYNQNYENAKFQNLWGLLGYLKQKNVKTIMLNVMSPLPDWLGGGTLEADKEDEWVEFLTSMLYYAKNTKGLRIDIVSPFNETDLGSPEGPHIDGDQYASLLGKLAARLDALGLSDIKLLGPDTAYPEQAVKKYIQPLMSNPAVMAKLAHFGLHSYSGETWGIADLLKKSAYPTKNFWMTEFSQWCDGCDTGQQPTNDWDFAKGTVAQLFSYLYQNASSAMIYEGYDSYYEHHRSNSYWGLLAYTNSAQGQKVYSPRKRFWANTQIYKFVDAGSVRIGADSSNEGLGLVSFQNPATGGLMIAGINSNSSPVSVKGQLSNLSPVPGFTLYVTSRSMDFTRTQDVSVINNEFTVTVPADSIFTLAYTGNTGNSATVVTPTTASNLPAARVSASLTRSVIPVGGTTDLTFTLNNPGQTPLTNVAFSDNLGPRILVANPPGIVNNCGSGAVSAPADSSTINVSGVLLAPLQSCTLKVTVTGPFLGSWPNSAGPASSNETKPGSNGNTVTLRVVNAVQVTTSADSATNPPAGSLRAVLSGVKSADGAIVTFAPSVTNPIILAAPLVVPANIAMQASCDRRVQIKSTLEEPIELKGGNYLLGLQIFSTADPVLKVSGAEIELECTQLNKN